MGVNIWEGEKAGAVVTELQTIADRLTSPGIPEGGTQGQIIKKKTTATEYDT